MDFSGAIDSSHQNFALSHARGEMEKPAAHRSRGVARFSRQFARAELDIERNPSIEVLDATTGRAVGCLKRAGFVEVIQKEALQIVDVKQPGIGEGLQAEGVRSSADGQCAI